MNSILILFMLFISDSILAKTPLTGDRLNQLAGENSKNYDHRALWDVRYKNRNYIYGKLPAKFLAENFHFLKPESQVLDIGIGEGRNAVFLASKGHKVTGIDISKNGILKAKKLAKKNNVRIKTIHGSIYKYPFQKEKFDAIICFYFVDRKLNQKLLDWLRPGGILIYEAFLESKKSKTEINEQNSFLKSGELLKMFGNSVKVLKFEEPNYDNSHRSAIILQKR